MKQTKTVMYPVRMEPETRQMLAWLAKARGTSGGALVRSLILREFSAVKLPETVRIVGTDHTNQQ